MPMYRIVSLMSVVWMVSSTLCAADFRQELELVHAGWVQRDSLIQTVQATCESRGVNLASGAISEPGESVIWVGDRSRFRYRRNPDLFGNKIPQNARSPVDQIVVDGVSTSLMSFMHADGQLDSQAIINTAGTGATTFTDYRARTLGFVLDSPPLTIADALADTSNIKSCELQGDGQYRVEYKIDEHTICRMWFDPEKGYLLTRKDKEYKTNPRFAGVLEQVVESQEASPGLWMATVIDMKHLLRSDEGGQKEPETASRFRVTSLIVNKPLPADAFKMEFPIGTEVSNKITGKLYFQQEGGPGPERALPEMQPPQKIETPLPQKGSTTTTTLIAVNLVLLGGLAVYFLARKKRG